MLDRIAGHAGGDIFQLGGTLGRLVQRCFPGLCLDADSYPDSEFICLLDDVVSHASALPGEIGCFHQRSGVFLEEL